MDKFTSRLSKLRPKEPRLKKNASKPTAKPPKPKPPIIVPGPEKREEPKEYSHLNNNVSMAILSMKRSGHHAIIHWIVCQCPKRVVWLNNVKKFQNPFDNHDTHTLPSGHYVPQPGKQKFKHRDYLIYSFEDPIPSKYNHAEYRNYIGESGTHFNILILRDVYNLMASRIKAEKRHFFDREWPGHKITREESVALWMSYAREFTREDSNFFKINYNRWFIDLTYRMELSKKLGLKHNDNGMTRVSPYGYGSSFDKHQYNGQAQNMDVLRRYEYFMNNPDFTGLFSKEVREMNKKIFSISI